MANGYITSPITVYNEIDSFLGKYISFFQMKLEFNQSLIGKKELLIGFYCFTERFLIPLVSRWEKTIKTFNTCKKA